MSYLGTGLSDIKYRIPVLPQSTPIELGTMENANTGNPHTHVSAFFFQLTAPSRLKEIRYQAHPANDPASGTIKWKIVRVTDFYANAITEPPVMETQDVIINGLAAGRHAVAVNQIIPPGDFLVVQRATRMSAQHRPSVNFTSPFALYSLSHTAYDGAPFSNRYSQPGSSNSLSSRMAWYDLVFG